MNTHRPASLYETFPAAAARQIAKRLEFHYTPKHGSWLNMAEIEFSVLSRSCLRQRLPDEAALQREVWALVPERNAAQATINWRFNTQDARSKLHRLYPFDSKHDGVLNQSQSGIYISEAMKTNLGVPAKLVHPYLEGGPTLPLVLLMRISPWYQFSTVST